MPDLSSVVLAPRTLPPWDIIWQRYGTQGRIFLENHLAKILHQVLGEILTWDLQRVEANIPHFDATSLPVTARRRAEWSELPKGPPKVCWQVTALPHPMLVLQPFQLGWVLPKKSADGSRVVGPVDSAMIEVQLSTGQVRYSRVWHLWQRRRGTHGKPPQSDHLLPPHLIRPPVLITVYTNSTALER